MKKLFISLVLMMICIGFNTFLPRANADTMTLYPTDDSMVADHDNFVGSRNTNYGSSEYLTTRMVIDQYSNVSSRDWSFLNSTSAPFLIMQP